MIAKMQCHPLLKTCHAAKFLKASSLTFRMPHVLEFLAREPQKLFLYSSDVVGIVSVSNGEPPVMLLCLGKQNLSDHEDVTDGTCSLLGKVFPSKNDFSAGDLQAPELLGEQAISLQGIYHELLDLKNQAFQNFEEEIVLN